MELRRCHPIAAFGATPTGFVASFHLGIVAEPLARSRALPADFRACPAHDGIHCGAAQHGAGTRTTDVGAGSHQCDVIRGGVFAALAQAIIDGLKAGGPTFGAGGDAVVGGLRTVFCGMMSHGCFLLLEADEWQRVCNAAPPQLVCNQADVTGPTV